MWLRRSTAFVKPGLMAQAVELLKGRKRSEGTAERRILRPATGPESNDQLILESAFEDPDAMFARWSYEVNSKWVEVSQHRAIHELYEIIQDVPSEGPPGPWVDRRVFRIKQGRMKEALDLQIEGPPGWRDALPGISFRLLRPRTGEDCSSILVHEFGIQSLAAFDEALATLLSSPEGAEWLSRWVSVIKRSSVFELYRVIG